MPYLFPKLCWKHQILQTLRTDISLNIHPIRTKVIFLESVKQGLSFSNPTFDHIWDFSLKYLIFLKFNNFPHILGTDISLNIHHSSKNFIHLESGNQGVSFSIQQSYF